MVKRETRKSLSEDASLFSKINAEWFILHAKRKNPYSPSSDDQKKPSNIFFLISLTENLVTSEMEFEIPR